MNAPALTNDTAAADKVFDVLRAKAALRGHRVHRLDAGGGFVIVGPGGWCSRELRDVHALAQQLRAVGVQA